MSVLRFLMLLALVVWVGGILFFSFAVAPTLFKVLPTRHLAGSVVTHSLALLHWAGLVCGVVFAITSMVHSYLARGAAQPLAARHILIYLMLALTIVSQFMVSPKMAALRASIGEIDPVPVDDARRIAFNQLHAWSTRLEGGVLLLGLVLLFLTARRIT